MPEPETVQITIELPHDEAELMAQHATETNSSISWWFRAACLRASYYVPLGTIPDDLRDALPFDDEALS